MARPERRVDVAGAGLVERLDDALAREHVARAAEAIAPFPDGPSKSALLAAADYAVGRES